ncbi:TPA: hypothetical protein ACOZJN_002011, partial [Streptococcus pneumoniae]
EEVSHGLIVSTPNEALETFLVKTYKQQDKMLVKETLISNFLINFHKISRYRNSSTILTFVKKRIVM